MAVTKIWDIKGSVGKLLDYAGNVDKTSERTESDIQDMTVFMDIAMLDRRANEFEHWRGKGIDDVIDYAVRDDKTEVKHYVTGINCTPENACDNMMLTKRIWQKMSGNSAYHGFQSFRPGEVTPDIAHEIGVKLAEKLWGDRFEVVVATHIDRDHVHNHFVLNSVSFVDGKKYNDCKASYMKMRKESDLLCREHGLSVIQNPQRGKSKHYSEWNAERKGHSRWRNLVKSDVDTAIRRSVTERQFANNLRSMGYEIKSAGKDISVRPPGKERFVRLQRNFGENYSIEGIRRRILAQIRAEMPFRKTETSSCKMKFNGVFHKPHRKAGLCALYYYYLYRMGVRPKQKERELSVKQIYFLYREDIRYMRRISEEARLLVKHSIDTDKQLSAHMENLSRQMTALTYQRQLLRNKSRSIKDGEKLTVIKGEISELSKSLNKLRRELWLCKDIGQRSESIVNKISLERNELRDKKAECTSWQPQEQSRYYDVR